MDIVERLLGRNSLTAAASNTRADSLDVHTKRLAKAQHSNFTREDSISVAKRRSQKARERGLDEQQQQQQPQECGMNSDMALPGTVTQTREDETPAVATPPLLETAPRQGRAADRSSCPAMQPSAASVAMRASDHSAVLHDSDIDLLSPEEQEALSHSRTDSIQLAKKKNPHIARERHGAGTPEPGGTKPGIFRQIIHRLTGSVIVQAQHRSGDAHTLASPSLPRPRRSVVSDPGDGMEPLHCYRPPPPGVHLRPALAHRSTDQGTPTPRTKSTSWQDHPVLPGTPTRNPRTPSLDIQPSIGANGLDSTFTHADILSVPASNPFT